jgi:hypothetical protein
VRCTGGNLNDEATKADVGRRSLLLAGTALPVLSVACCGLQLQQARAQPSSSQSTPATAGNAVAVAPLDTVAAIQAKLKSVPAGGTLEFPANSAFNFNGQTVKGRSGITVLAKGPVTINGAPGPGTAGAFDFGGLSSWTLRGSAPGQGFVFNNTLVNADGSKQGAVGHCVFNNVASNGLNGSAIRMTGASFLLVINNDFNGCQGNVLGQYDWDNIRLDGNHFTNCWQPVSIDQGSDTSRGRNITFVRNILSGEIRAGFETGGTADGTATGAGQVFTNLRILGNWFVNLGGPAEAGPLSLVARSQTGTQIIGNYFLRGPNYNNNTPERFSQAVEYACNIGPAVILNNLIVDFSDAWGFYGAGAVRVDPSNLLFNTGSKFGGTVLTARPTDPPQPVRVAW